ncbi:MAG TPA: hypothetical protein VG753_03055 [Candidatus Paceibacterota bacterium]|nr:hypothetical protein [Candidatus Paceibacterota bacterium]
MIEKFGPGVTIGEIHALVFKRPLFTSQPAYITLVPLKQISKRSWRVSVELLLSGQAADPLVTAQAVVNKAVLPPRFQRVAAPIDENGLETSANLMVPPLEGENVLDHESVIPGPRGIWPKLVGDAEPLDK